MNTQETRYEPSERLEELLLDRAVFGLDSAEAAEIATLAPEGDLPEEYELLAAQVFLANSPEGDRLPDSLRERVLGYSPSAQSGSASVSPASGGPAQAAPVTRDTSGWTSALFAIAASLLLGLWLGSLSEVGSKPGAGSPSRSETELAVASLDEFRQRHSDAVTVAWSATEDKAAVGIDGETRDGADWGEVVWSDSAQQGYMRFRGLEANDPAVAQYQLWIFDANRDDAHPVDGGVFDIAADTPDGEQLVRINAKLSVSKATLFAITVERPGGVVVSDRSRLPLLAQL